MRALKTTNLTFGLLNLSVQVCKAIGSTSEPQAKVVGPDGEEVTQVYVDKSENIVDRAVTKRRVGDKVFTQDALKEINEACAIQNLEIQEFVPKAWLPQERRTDTYYIQSDKKNGNLEHFKALIEGMKKRDVVALTKWTPRSRQQLLALYVDEDKGDALVAVALSFAEDFKQPDEQVLAHNEVEVKPEVVDMAANLIQALEGDGTFLAEAKDDAIEKKRELIESGGKVKLEKAEPTKNASDLMDQLAKSIDQVKEKTPVSV